MTAYDPSELICKFCHTPTIFMDYKQGDATCTSCGLVNAERLVYEGAEWRDFSAVNDEDKKNLARAGSVVDESRWNGGLEPTSLGPVFGGYSGDGERHRKTLNKVKRVVDHWVDKQFEKRVDECRLAIKLKDQRKRQLGSDGVKVENDEQDWSELGTHEHEQIAMQRMDKVEALQKMLVSEKWSLDRALLLHGSSDEIPSRYVSYNQLAGETPRDIQDERDSVLKRMDTSQRKASEDLYKAYSLIQESLKQLDLIESVGVMSEVMDVISRYANMKGSLTVKGVSTKIPISSNTKTAIEEQRSYNKFRQIGAIGAAFIYFICKKNGLTRTLAEICASLHHESSVRTDDAFIKAKHCSKAITEIRNVMPGYVQSLTVAATEPNEDLSSKPSAVKLEAVASSSVSAASTSKEDRLASITANSVEHYLKNQKLSPVAISAITYLVIHMKRHTSESKRSAIIIAAISYLVCDAGSTMQRLASQTRIAEAEANIKSESYTNEDGKRSHIRPAAARSNKRRQISGGMHAPTSYVPLSVSSSPLEAISSMEVKAASVTPEPEFDALLQQVNESRSTSFSSQPPSWSEWKNEKPWGRAIKQLEICCFVKGSAAKDYYKKEIYPKRKELLCILQKCFPHNTEIDGCKADIMMSNIAAATPLMNTTPK